MCCHRCYYNVGVTSTNCRICGANAPRVRISVIALASLVIGLGLGSAALAVL